MRRRILLAFVGLTAAILIGAVIPLGIKASEHDYSAYVEDAQSRARTAVAAAEERLSDHLKGAGLGRTLAAAGHVGDGIAVLTPGGRVVEASGPRVHIPRRMIGRALASGGVQTEVARDRVLVVAPVRTEGSTTIGLVALERPTERFEYGLRQFWLELALIAVAALVAAVLLGIGLARWVAKPLAMLDGSARRLGEGDLSARAAGDAGPPEIRRLTDTFNTMAGRLETLLHGHRAVIEDVSHQLRTPLAALRLRLDLLAPGDDDPAAAEFSGALGEVARLSRLVDGLLAVARAENAMPRTMAVNLDEVIAERVAAWAPVAADKGIKLTGDAPRPVRAVIGDGYLEQILDNLLANAIDAAGEGNHVTVAARPTRRGASVIVADDGPGMSQADQDRAFRRFSTGSGTGSGLGLAIVHRLASSSGGEARLAETPGGGLTVTVDLPGPVAAGDAAAGHDGS